MLPIFLEKLNIGSIHVYSPRATIFVCGGKTEEDLKLPPNSIRDALLRADQLPAITKSQLFVVEKVTESFLREGVYGDFYQFENDMAQVCDLVLLISESPGSFTELGSFTRDKEVANKLFTIIRNCHFGDGSYIDVGPIKYLEDNQRGSVFVVSDAEYSIDESNYATIDTDLLAKRLRDPVIARINTAKEHTLFDRKRNGHLCKLVTGLVQEFGALETGEIQEMLNFLDVPNDQITAEKIIFCGKTVDWIRTDRRGLRTFVLPNISKRATKFAFVDETIPSSTERRRLQIMQNWERNDPERRTAIAANIAAMSEEVAA